MSDSDEDPSNIFGRPNEGTTFYAKGPNATANMTSISFRTNVSSSTIKMPWNSENHRFANFNIGHNNDNYRRPSTMSVRSDYNVQRRNNSHRYPGGSYSQRSVINGRSGSPMSMRSNESVCSMTACEIAMAFKTMKFNKYDFRLIREAYQKYMKYNIRSNIERRRKLRLRTVRRKSGYDSGDSSLSSDNCRSIKTTTFKENVPQLTFTSPEKVLSNYRNSIHNNKHSSVNNRCNLFQSQHLDDQNHVTNHYTEMSNTMKQSYSEIKRNNLVLPSQKFKKSVVSCPIPENSEENPQPQPNTINSLKERFTSRNGFLLPSQRFNKSKTDTSTMDLSQTHNRDPNTSQSNASAKCNVNPEKRCNTKRNLDRSDIPLPGNKRFKMSSPRSSSSIQSNTENNGINNEFEFAKPQFPIKKVYNLNKKNSTKLLQTPSNSANDENTANVSKINDAQQHFNNTSFSERECTASKSTADVSERPSFIKRKLFTQNLEIAESKTSSSEGSAANSPHTKANDKLPGEKHKARKLVTNQSCLQRDIEDNSLVDLIHKLVPAEKINMTISNKAEVNKANKEVVEKEKWDISSIVSTCNMDNISDTFTDEEIFDVENTVFINKKEEVKIANCKVVLENILTKPNKCKVEATKELKRRNTNEQTKPNGVEKSFKSFWDESDMETDVDQEKTLSRHNTYKYNQIIIGTTVDQIKSSGTILKENQDKCTKENKQIQKKNIKVTGNVNEHKEAVIYPISDEAKEISCEKKSRTRKITKTSNKSHTEDCKKTEAKNSKKTDKSDSLIKSKRKGKENCNNNNDDSVNNNVKTKVKSKLKRNQTVLSNNMSLASELETSSRSRRSGKANLTTSFDSLPGNTTIKKPIQAKNKVVNKRTAIMAEESDISFSLIDLNSPAGRVINRRRQKTNEANEKPNNLVDSDISFSLHSDSPVTRTKVTNKRPVTRSRNSKNSTMESCSDFSQNLSNCSGLRVSTRIMNRKKNQSLTSISKL